MITFIISLFNLFGVNSGITSIVLFVCNLVLFFILNYINAYKLKKKGFIEGLLLGVIYVILMIIIKLLLFSSPLNISSIIYYIILLLTSILGGMFGVNKKSDE